jgi:chaperonin GroEL
LDKVGSEVLGHASKVVLTKDTTTIVADGSTQEAVNKRVAQIKNLIEVSILLALHSQQNVGVFIFSL